MNISLIGYGKMGKEIEKAAVERGHSVHLTIDIDNIDDLKSDKFKSSDMAIEFTNPSSVLNNLSACFDAGVPVVTGTTGWHDDINKVIEECYSKNQALLYASNFSIGVNIFFAVNKYLAEVMNSFDQYDVRIKETHHTQKLDAPSGTAINIADILINALNKKKKWISGKSGSESEIPVEAIREGDVKGVHEVIYDSEIDYIQLKHSAKTRKGFAQGAVLAAEFLQGKTGVYSMDDLLGL